MNFRRLGKHLFTSERAVRRVLPGSALYEIEGAIASSESLHSGQIRFAVEAALDAPEVLAGVSARERAIEVFSQLRVWDTEQNNGVLIYLLLADHDVEIVADRGIDARVGPGWEEICHTMEQAFSRGEFENGVLHGIAAVSEHLRLHYPLNAAPDNELPDAPVVIV